MSTNIDDATGIDKVQNQADLSGNESLPHNNYAKFQDRKSLGVSGGSSSTSLTDRDLNYEDENMIIGCSLNTGTGVVTVQAGTYYARGKTCHYRSNNGIAFLYNITSASNIAQSMNKISYPGTDGSTTLEFTKKFTVLVETEIKIRQQVDSAQASNGFGVASSIGDYELYTELELWKVS